MAVHAGKLLSLNKIRGNFNDYPREGVHTKLLSVEAVCP